jgi:hypothetical protein
VLPSAGMTRTSTHMRTRQTGFDAVREIALGLPGVEEGTTYGSPAFKVDGKMFVCLAVHRSAEPNTLVVRMDFDERNGLIAAEPKTYYLTDHYVDYPCVLVRLTRVRHDALVDLVLSGWRFVSSAKSRKAANRRQ